MSSFQYVNVQNFTPNSGNWTPLANVTAVVRNGNVFTVQMSASAPLIVSPLGNWELELGPSLPWAAES